ncbi:MAG: hypothetical protein AB1531_08415, partial [Chloroflexota bacterium]
LVFLLSACSLPDGTPSGDPCVQGNWVMPTGDLDILMATLVPLPNLRVTAGELLMSFDSEAFSYLSYGFILHIDMDEEQWMEATASFENTGTFFASEGEITFSSVGSESEISSWTGYDHGETITVPGSGPQLTFTLPGTTTYRCSDEYLELDSPHPTLGTIVYLFTRRP